MKRKSIHIIYGTILIIVIIVAGILIRKQISISNNLSQEVAQNNVDRSVTMTAREKIMRRILETKNSTSTNYIASTTQSYEYLFEVKAKDSSSSNIVGYFAGGAFAWYVPDWLVENWTVKPNPSVEGIIISPKNFITYSQISDIVIEVGTSTETFNANSIYDEVTRNPYTISEVLLSKHASGNLTIVMETGTRIYHVQREMSNRIFDLYMMDGNGKTAVISFNSDKENFHKYATKIRDLVEGIGEVKTPQG